MLFLPCAGDLVPAHFYGLSQLLANAKEVRDDDSGSFISRLIGSARIAGSLAFTLDICGSHAPNTSER